MNTSTSFVKLTPSLKSLSAQSQVVSNIANEIKALFPEDELPALRYRVELIRQICIACRDHSDSSRVLFVNSNELASLISKVHTAIFGEGVDDRDNLYLEEVIAYLLENGDLNKTFFGKMYFFMNRIFR